MTHADGASIDVATGVPAELLRFNRSLRSEGGGALELLAGFDAYTNQEGSSPADILRSVPIRQVSGWRVTADVYVPHGDPPWPVLVWLHGGAWVLGAPATHRRLATDLCSLGLLTLVIDYRRAPKHRFPAGVDDTQHAIAWAAEHAAEHGGDPELLFVGGDSAGANLAAAALAVGTAVRVRGAVLCYGIYDVHRALPTLSDLVGGPDLDSQLYLEPDDARRFTNDPRLHPERYCADFPATLILAGDEDPLLPESIALAGRLTDEDVAHRLLVLSGTPHGFLQMPTHLAHAAGLQAIKEFITAPLARPG